MTQLSSLVSSNCRGYPLFRGLRVLQELGPQDDSDVQAVQRATLPTGPLRFSCVQVLVMAGQLKRENPKIQEDLVLIRALRDSNLPKFLADDAILFKVSQLTETYSFAMYLHTLFSPKELIYLMLFRTT